MQPLIALGLLEHVAGGLGEAELRQALAGKADLVFAVAFDDHDVREDERAGVVAVPSMVFFDNQDEGASIIRFAFCKKDEVIDEAVTRLKAGLS